MDLSERLRSILEEMKKSGQSEARYVADAMEEIASNGDDMATDEDILSCAKEMKDWCDIVINNAGGSPKENHNDEKACYLYAYSKGLVHVWRALPDGAWPIAKGPLFKLTRFVSDSGWFRTDGRMNWIAGVAFTADEEKGKAYFLRHCAAAKEDMEAAGLTPIFEGAGG